MKKPKDREVSLRLNEAGLKIFIEMNENMLISYEETLDYVDGGLNNGQKMYKITKVEKI